MIPGDLTRYHPIRGLVGIERGHDLDAKVGMDGDGQGFPRAAGKQEVDSLAAVIHLPGNGQHFRSGSHFG